VDVVVAPKYAHHAGAIQKDAAAHIYREERLQTSHLIAPQAGLLSHYLALVKQDEQRRHDDGRHKSREHKHGHRRIGSDGRETVDSTTCRRHQYHRDERNSVVERSELGLVAHCHTSDECRMLLWTIDQNPIAEQAATRVLIASSTGLFPGLGQFRVTTPLHPSNLHHPGREGADQPKKASATVVLPKKIESFQA